MRNSDKDAALQAVYDQIPPMANCKGLCWNSCGPAPMSDRERQRLKEAGHRVTDVEVARRSADTYWCEALTSEGRCGAYAVRPAVCRIFGTVRSMRCPFGCVPEGGWLDDVEGLALLAESVEIGGGDLGATAAEIRDKARDPRARADLLRFMGAHGDISRFPSRTSTELPPEIRNRKPRRGKTPGKEEK